MTLGESFADVPPAIGFLLVFAIVGGVIILIIRKQLKFRGGPTITFSLHDLEKMRDEGAITEDEYQRARQSIIDQAKVCTTDSHV